jgi:hypothetical protein
MIRQFVALLLLVFPWVAFGQSTLPPCPVSGVRDNCVAGETVNGNTYFGEYRSGKPNGIGSLIYAVSGDRYVGEWVDGQRNGDGIEYRADGSVFEVGRWISGRFSASTNIQRNRFPFDFHLETARLLNRRYLGSGLYTSPNSGRVYQGELKGGRFVGKSQDGISVSGDVERHEIVFGEFAFPNGQTYIGSVKDGLFHGQGTRTLANGNKYVGEFRDGKPHGQGMVAFADGRKHIFAEWKDGLPGGEGIRYRSDGTVEDSGRFEAGKLVAAYPIDTNRFPFKRPAQVAATPTVDPGKSERDRLEAEVEAERKKREELEVRLATEAKERERLATEAKERERQLAEAKERERQQAQTPQPPQPQAAIRNERRVALLVGNGAYKQSPLTNSVNDAVDLNASLKNLGFQTLLVQNASLATMRQKTREFAELALNADVALIFFSGHGIEYRGNNYLIPTSAGSLKEFEVEDETFNVARWMDMLETQKGANKQRVNIVILDACRDNAFSRGWRNTNRGLARMDAPSGTILAYATAPGKLASDGSAGERNSPYTKNLLRAIQQPNVPVEQVFKDVRRMVVEQTKGEQVPWENSSLIGNFVFKR